MSLQSTAIKVINVRRSHWLKSIPAHARRLRKTSQFVYARLFVILDKNMSVSSAVKQMDSLNAAIKMCYEYDLTTTITTAAISLA